MVRVAGTLAVAGVVLALAVAAGRLPSDTSAGTLVVRAAVGLGIGLVILWVVRRMLGALAEPPPPAPERVDAREVDVVYECGICGTRLRLEVAATGKAPRHCGEEMSAAVVEA